MDQERFIAMASPTPVAPSQPSTGTAPEPKPAAGAAPASEVAEQPRRPRTHAEANRGGALPGLRPEPGFDPHADTPVTSKAEMRAAYEKSEADKLKAAEPSPTVTGKERGPDGKFVAKAGGPEPTDVAPVVEATPQPTPAPTAKYKVGDIEFDSEQHAVQALKTFKGQAESVNRLKAEKEHADGIANQWMARALLLENQLKSGTHAQPSNPNSPTGRAPESGSGGQPESAAEKSFRESVDWKEISDMAQDPKYGFVGAMAYLSDQMDAYNSKRLEKIQQPLRQTAEQHKFVSDAAALWGQAKEYKENGQVAFPELSDAQAGDRIIDIWRENNPDQDVRSLSPNAIYHAILQYRDERRRAGLAPVSSSATPPSPDAAAVAASLIPNATPPAPRPEMIPASPVVPSSQRFNGGVADTSGAAALKRGIREAGLYNSGLPGVRA